MNIKKLLALLLAIVMVLSLAACGSTDDDDDDDDKDKEGTSATDEDKDGEDEDTDEDKQDDDKKDDDKKDDEDEDSLVGKWEGEMNLGAAMDAMLTGEVLFSYCDFDDLAVTMTFTFDDDGTLEIEVDEDSCKDMVDDIVDIVMDGIEEYLDANGATWDDVGATKSEMREAMMEQFSEDAIMEMAESMAGSGYYVAVDDRIYTAEDEDDLEDEVDEDSSYMEFSLKGDKLTIKDIVDDGESIDDYIPGMMPITLKRK